MRTVSTRQDMCGALSSSKSYFWMRSSFIQPLARCLMLKRFTSSPPIDKTPRHSADSDTFAAMLTDHSSPIERFKVMV